ncbi:MAG TPA: hypothetical protein VFY01_02165, partial [Rheinheimera sp.]|nr:hypothetical protein [Rheinheimera sp.]
FVSGVGIKLAMQQYPLFDYSAVEITAAANTDMPSAYIAAYSKKEQQILTLGGVEVINISYYFEGRHDANRADYYLNSMIPDNWSKVDNETTANSRLIWLSDHSGNNAIVQYWYQANGQKTGSVKVYKHNRIRQALRLDATSSLHWQFARCNSLTCQDEARILRQLIDN